MQKITLVILATCLIQATFSACSDGTHANTYYTPTQSKAIECIQCLPFCKTCSDTVSCLTWNEGAFKGLTSTSAVTCSGTNSVTSTTGYNKDENACARCAEGCSTCYVDYDYCTNCKAGWDWDRSGMKCVRATLGLAAVVLALSVLILIFGVVTCILSCKL